MRNHSPQQPHKHTRARERLTLVALERLEKLHQRLRSQLLVVLGGDLNAQLQVLTQVCSQHGPQTLDGVADRQRAEEIHQPLMEREKKNNTKCSVLL